jgi:hypothetical protein
MKVWQVVCLSLYAAGLLVFEDSQIAGKPFGNKGDACDLARHLVKRTRQSARFNG